MGYCYQSCLALKTEVLSQALNKEPEATKSLLDQAFSVKEHGDSTLITWERAEWGLGDLDDEDMYLGDDTSNLRKFWEIIESAGAKNYLFLQMGECFGDLRQIGRFFNNPWKSRIIAKIDISDP